MKNSIFPIKSVFFFLKFGSPDIRADLPSPFLGRRWRTKKNIRQGSGGIRGRVEGSECFQSALLPSLGSLLDLSHFAFSACAAGTSGFSGVDVEKQAFRF